MAAKSSKFLVRHLARWCCANVRRGLPTLVLPCGNALPFSHVSIEFAWWGLVPDPGGAANVVSNE